MQQVPLKPFNPKETQDIQIFVQFEIFKGIFKIAYQVTDPRSLIQDLEVANPGMKNLDEHSRADELWKKTCLEFFVKKVDSKNYFEFNGSAEGLWNFYKFKEYRSPIEPELRVNEVKMSASNNRTAKIIAFELDFNPLFSDNDSLLFSFSSVIKQGANITYWSHKHSSEKPDFHHVNNFTIQAKFK